MSTLEHKTTRKKKWEAQWNTGHAELGWMAGGVIATHPAQQQGWLSKTNTEVIKHSNCSPHLCKIGDFQLQGFQVRLIQHNGWKITVIQEKRSQSNSHRAGCSRTFHQQQQAVSLNYRWQPHLEQVQPSGTRKRAPLCEGMSHPAALPEHWRFHAERSSGISHIPAEIPAKQVCTAATKQISRLGLNHALLLNQTEQE